MIKTLSVLLLTLVLAGCYESTPYNNPELLIRAEIGCKDLGGVYKWYYDSVSSDEQGYVQCYFKRTVVNLFEVEVSE